jgi:hypothetical protein
MVRPLVIVNPRSDPRFVDAVERLAATADTPGALQELLRPTFPSAVVRERELSAEPFEVWYAYRDGRWTPSPPARQEEAGDGSDR